MRRARSGGRKARDAQRQRAPGVARRPAYGVFKSDTNLNPRSNGANDLDPCRAFDTFQVPLDLRQIEPGSSPVMWPLYRKPRSGACQRVGEELGVWGFLDEGRSMIHNGVWRRGTTILIIQIAEGRGVREFVRDHIHQGIYRARRETALEIRRADRARNRRHLDEARDHDRGLRVMDDSRTDAE